VERDEVVVKKAIAAVVFLLLSSTGLYADVAVTDRSSVVRALANQTGLRPQATDAASDQTARHAAAVAENQAKKAAKLAKRLHGLTPKATDTASDRAARHAAAVAENQAKKAAKLAKRHHGLTPVTQAFHPRTTATGSIGLIDASGLKYFINTNITTTGSTGSSLSGAASEASYTHAVAATTSAGGTTMSTLNDEFDGYGAICVSLTNASGPCTFPGNATYTDYYNNGPAAFDATVPPGSACTNRQVAYPAQTIGGLSVKRKVFVPTNDTFIRWMNFFTNTTGSPITFTMITDNNLGSDSNTVITNSSNGDTVAQATDTWITSFQAYSGNVSTDVRTGVVIQGTGAPTPVSNITFVNGNDRPFWNYSITLAPGQTKAILIFSTGQPSKAAANAKSAALALLPANATQCLSATELGQIVNFAVNADLSIVKSTAAPVAFGSNPITFTLAVTNNGPSSANTVSVVDTLPAGSTFVSASGTGWVCNNVAGTVTCTVASLPLGAAPVINLTFNAPPVVTAGTLSNTATVSSATTDPTPANNSSTKTVPIFPGNQIPALSTWMLGLLAATLGFVALARRT
jgi:uncharacterized repeat protein (TIGR01451 family)